MSSWKDLKIDQAIRIEKLAAEFEVWDIHRIPAAKFKVKIFESQDGKYTGRTNLKVIDKNGDFCAGVGHGNTAEEALVDTVRYFYSKIAEVEDLLALKFPSNDECFEYIDAIRF